MTMPLCIAGRYETSRPRSSRFSLTMPDAHIVKAELVTRIDAIVWQRGITQAEAGRLLGLSQPDVSRRHCQTNWPGAEEAIIEDSQGAS